MEANEAPEKIYIQPDAQDYWFMVNNLNNTLVEYIRTDTFIEETCKWLQEEVVDDYAGLVWENLIEDFRKYIQKRIRYDQKGMERNYKEDDRIISY